MPRTLPGEVVEGEIADGDSNCRESCRRRPTACRPHAHTTRDAAAVRFSTPRTTSSPGGRPTWSVRPWRPWTIRPPIRQIHTSPPRARRRATFADGVPRMRDQSAFMRPQSHHPRGYGLSADPSSACRSASGPCSLVETGGSRKGEMSCHGHRNRAGPLGVRRQNAGPGDEARLVQSWRRVVWYD